VRPATGLICQFIDGQKQEHGVVPVCRALAARGIQIAPRTYWAYRSRGPSRRELRDTAVAEILAGIYEPGPDGRRQPESMYGTLKVWDYLRRQGIEVAECTVDRVKREHGWRGRTRSRRVRTTIPDPGAARAPDLVHRKFRTDRPGRLHVAGFTYVPLVSGRFVYTAFVIDAYAGLIPGWECSVSEQTAFIESALRQAAEYRRRNRRELTRDAIHHSDAGSQGGFNRSSQHFKWRWANGATARMGSCPGRAAGDAFAGAPCGGRAGGPTAVLGGDRQGNIE
jgi:hypothetical protein